MTKTRLILPLLAVLLFAAPARAALVEDLFVAVAGNDLAEVQTLLDRGADVNFHDMEARTSLCIAVEKGFVEMAKLLIDRGADVDKTGTWRRDTALHHLLADKTGIATDRYRFDDRVWNDDVEGIKAALAEGLEEGVLSRDLSEYARSSAMLSVLIPAGMPVDRQALLRFVPSETPEDTAERMKLLIEGGADVHVQNGWRETPLAFMARLCHVDRPAIGVAIVRTLLAAGADPNAGEPDTRPPLFEWRNLSSECVRLLLEAGARADATWNGTTILQYFGDTQPVEDAAETVRLLIAAGADPDAHPKGTDGTPLTTLQGNAQSAGVVKALLDAGARPNGGSGTNPLRTAAGGGKGRLESVKLLLAAGAKADAPDEWGITPLMIAGACTEPQREDRISSLSVSC